MTYHNYQWTAFTEADFLDQGGNGSSIGCGDTFKMPGSSTVTMSTWDNDNKLSGDSWSNDKSDDQNGQTAYVDGHKVGGKVYAESYHVLKGSDGKTYYMIEIEIEGHSAPGAGDDYFTFYGKVPPAGVELTVTQTCNVKGEWVDFACLGAGEAAPANTAPTFTNDPADGVICIDENTTFVIDLNADDADGDTLTYEIVGGADAGHFSIDAHSGELTFNAAPDYENPTSKNGNNTYDVTVKVSDGNGGSETKAMWVKVKDVDESTGNGECIVIEAEDMNLYHMKTFGSTSASGGAGARIDCLGGSGDLSTTFNGSAGNYDLTIFAQDENDGNSTIMVKVNGQVVDTIHLNQNNDGGGSNNGNFSEFTIQDVALNAGDKVNLWVKSDAGEYVRIDKIELCQDGEVCPADYALLDFEGFASGTVIDNQFEGVTITAQRTVNNTAANDAMIFDSNNPTGGDHDLEYNGRGNILIVSEDNDSNDADDAVGGKMTFDFDNPSDLHDIVLLDIEEAGGTIMLTFEDGSTQTIDIPAAGNNSAQTIDLSATGVTQMMINLVGSGAVDDLCWKAGEAPAPASLGGTYFMDANNNDIQDAGDMGVAGATVALLLNGVQIATDTTDADGNYLFENLAAGDGYSVRFIDTGEGKTFVDGNVGGDDTIDSDVVSVGGAGNGNTGTISLAAGEDKRNVDGGIEDPGTASLAGRVFEDSDDDNQDNGEAGVGGVTVTLLNGDGTPTGLTAVTEPDGSYIFENLDAGDYIVDFPTEVDGKVLVDSNVGNDATDSDADQGNGQTGVISLAIGENSINTDAGIEDPAGSAIEGVVFMDNNDDSQNGAGDMGVSGVTVTLLNADGSPTGRTTTTGADGSYAFAGLVAGGYIVSFPTEVDGKTLVDSNVGPDATDSDALANGQTGVINVGVNETSSNNDAGVEDPGTASIGDKLFLDLNGNGQQDNGEAGVDGVEVTLTDADGNTTTTTTANGGMYLFDGLDAGDYVVDFADVEGFDFTQQNNGNDASDSDVDANGSTDPVSLAIGEENLTVDAGLVSEGPDAADDAAMTCANEEVTVDVLANDGATASTITQVGGQNIAEGQTVVVGGVEVTLSSGELVFDGEAAYEALDIGESATATISYTVADDFGGTTTADVDVTFCGVAETLAEICESLPAQVQYEIRDGYANGDTTAYDIRLTSSDVRLDGLEISNAFCVSALDPASAGQTFDAAPLLTGDLYCTVDPFLADSVLAGQMGANGQSAADNMDLVNWILNQDFNSAEFAGAGFTDGVTEAEAQAAVWNLTDGTGFIGSAFGQIDDVNAIVALAEAQGEGFEAGAGDTVGLIIDPNPATATNAQPFIIGIEFNDLDCIC